MHKYAKSCNHVPWLAPSRVVVLDEPTRDIDVRARPSLCDLVTDFARQGVARIAVGSDFEGAWRVEPASGDGARQAGRLFDRSRASGASIAELADGCFRCCEGRGDPSPTSCNSIEMTFYIRRSQGGVQFPTGGIRSNPGARERFRFRKVSRSGEMPGPTV